VLCSYRGLTKYAIGQQAPSHSNKEAAPTERCCHGFEDEKRSDYSFLPSLMASEVVFFPVNSVG